MITIERLENQTDCEYSRSKNTLCAVVSRDGFPEQRIALSKLAEALRLIVPVREKSACQQIKTAASKRSADSRGTDET